MLQPRDTLKERYRILEPLGQGGMGIVYLAEDSHTQQQVAIKVLNIAPDEGQRRFRRELRTMSRLNHPNVVTTLDSGIHQQRPYLVMAYIAGGTLQARYPQGVTDLQDVVARLRVAEHIAQALQYIHSQGIVHRDLKPENIMLEPLANKEVRAVLMDFGLAKSDAQDSLEITRSKAIMGTAAYMSPEQVRGASLDLRSDLYAFGCLLYQLLLGRPPFVALSFGDMLIQQVKEPAQAPSQHCPWLPTELDTLLLRLLEKVPADRYSSAEDTLAILQNIRQRLERTLQTSSNAANIEQQPPVSAASNNPFSGDTLALTEQPDISPKQLLNVALIGRESLWQQLSDNLSNLVAHTANSSTDNAEHISENRPELENTASDTEAASNLHTAHYTLRLDAQQGMGLSRLLSEFRREARLQDAYVLQLRNEASNPSPYQLWQRALRQLERLYPEAYQQASSGLEPILTTLRNPDKQDPPDTPDASQPAASLATLPAQVLQLRLYDGLDQLFSRMAHSRPLVLLIDDSEQADEASLQLLSYLSRSLSASRCLLVFGVHPESLSASKRGILQSINAQTQRLEGFNEANMRHFIEALLGAEVDSGLMAYVAERADGRPYIARELLAALLQAGQLRRHLGMWEWHASEQVIPETLHSVVLQRLENVPERAQRQLRFASCIGPAFHFDVLLWLTQADEDLLLDDLDALLRAGFIHEKSADQYSFSTVLLRESLHAQLETSQRQQLHERLADYLQQHKPEADQLAWHYAESSQPARAIPYALQAAGEAQRLFANDIAERYYRLALRFASENSAQQADICLELGQILERVGKWPETEQLYQQAARHPDTHLQAKALHRLGVLAQRQGDLPRSEDYLRRSLELSTVKSQLISDLGRTLSLKGDFDAAQELLYEGLALIMQLGDAQQAQALPRAHIDLAELESHRGQWQESIAWLQAAQEASSDHNEPLLQAKISNLMGIAQRRIGNLQEARLELEKAQSIYQDVGDLERALSVMLNLANILFETGEHELALITSEKVQRNAFRLGEERLQATALANQAVILIEQGENLEQAHDLLQQACQLFSKLGLTHHEVHSRLSLVQLKTFINSTQEAEEELDLVSSLLAQSPQPYYQAMQQLRFAEKELRMGHVISSVPLLQKAISELETMQSDLDMLEAYVLLAEAYLLLEQANLFEEMLTKAAELAQETNEPQWGLVVAYLRACKSQDVQEIEDIAEELELMSMGYILRIMERTRIYHQNSVP